MKYYSRLILVIFVLFGSKSTYGQNRSPILSHLYADIHTPLYTTYAAAMSRSEYTLDEGFHLIYYDSLKGIDMSTDKAGDWCLAFKKNGQFVYRLAQMYQAPIITCSYPDMVTYHYFPFKDLRVQINFFVFSSKLALQDIILTNVSKKKVNFTLYSFLKNNYRTFNNVKFKNKQNAIFFSHEELPDAWTLAHHIPYVNNVYDFFLFSISPDYMKSFRKYKWGNVSIPRQVFIERKKKYLVTGQFKFIEYPEFYRQKVFPKMMVFLNNMNDTVLTETAPRWGDVTPNISNWGYGIELGNFPSIKVGDCYTIRLFFPNSPYVAIIHGKIGSLSKYRSVSRIALFKKKNLPDPPKHFRKDVWGDGTEIRLYWDKKPGMRYNVYRRDYRKNGYYILLAKNLSKAFFTDKNIKGDKIYGYFITAVDSQNRMSGPTDEVTNVFGSDFITDVKYPNQIKTDVRDFVRVISLQKQFGLLPDESTHLRIIRGFASNKRIRTRLLEKAQNLLKMDLKSFIKANEDFFSNAPSFPVKNTNLQLLYWSAYNMMRQVFLPPEGQCHFNYYVFSREPTWGWGHGGQVFHESMAMLAYDLLDAQSAMNSQRIFCERQYSNGYINYRSGPYLNETIEYNGEKTTSAPWYAWENWEIYRKSRDLKFLKEMYESSSKFYYYFVKYRDKDHDGLCEWGGHAVLESVRDGEVVIWDKVGWPSNFEALDLNCMLVKEAKALAEMAAELGKTAQAEEWRKEAQARSERINKFFWDEKTGFYYHVDMKDHDFTFKKKDDLKRQEIIGFLPLWAGIASPKQAKRLVETLLDTTKFWRRYGIPSLAADDPYYNPTGYWNGPVWVQWNYLIEQGLLRYGYFSLAKQLVDKVANNMIFILKTNHNLWEFYSPDSHWAGYHKTYIWAGIINRMLLDVYGSYSN